jgi:hypothetical protein
VGGLTAGFLVTLAFLGVAGWLINGDHEWSGTVLGSVDLVALVTVFVLGRKSAAPTPPPSSRSAAGPQPPTEPSPAPV